MSDETSPWDDEPADERTDKPSASKAKAGPKPLRSATAQKNTVWRPNLDREHHVVATARKRAQFPKGLRQTVKPVKCPDCTVETTNIDGKIVHLNEKYTTEVLTKDGALALGYRVSVHHCDPEVVRALDAIGKNREAEREWKAGHAELVKLYKELSPHWGKIVVIDTAMRNKTGKTVDCTRCIGKAGDNCYDLRAEFSGRQNKHVHVERFMAAIKAQGREAFTRPDGELCLRDIQPDDCAIPAAKLGKG